MDKRVYIQNGSVLSDDLNFTEDSKNEQVRDRIQSFLGYSKELSYGLPITTGSVFRGGVCGNPLDYWKYDNLKAFNFISPVEFNMFIFVCPGKALTANGDLITIDDFQLLSWAPAIFNWPWNMGSSEVGYVKLQYQEASSSLEYDDYGLSHYLHYDRSFNLIANNQLPTADDILLATFLSDSTGKISPGTFQDRRSYATSLTPASSILLNSYFTPALTLGWDSFEDHAHAYGTGVPSVINPHAIAPIDIGAAYATGSINYTTFSSISVGPTMVLDTIYQNTRGYTIGVSALCSCTVRENLNGDILSGIQLHVGSSSPPTWVAAELQCGIDNFAGTHAMSGSITHNLFAIVPNGWYYKLATNFSGWTVNDEISWGDSISTLYYLTP